MTTHSFHRRPVLTALLPTAIAWNSIGWQTGAVLGPVVGGWLPMGESSEPLRYAAGFALVFIATAFLCGALATLARRAAKAIGMRPVDRFFGALFGVLRGVLMLLVLAALVLMTPLRDEPWWRQSLSAPWLETTLAQLHPWLPAGFGKYLSA